MMNKKFESTKKLEMKIYGINACHTLFKQRPSDIIRAYVTEAHVKRFSMLLKYCAQNKRAYRIVTDEELNKITESNHHEGICLLIKKQPLQTEDSFLNKQRNNLKPSCVVALENVENPHNIGAILRICANFGADALLMVNARQAQSSAAYRTAEGGAEWVPILDTLDLRKSLIQFKTAGYKIIATSSHIGNSLFKENLPQKSLFLLGSESEGLSNDILRTSDIRIHIPSTGRVESLNVACAAGILLSEFYRKNI